MTKNKADFTAIVLAGGVGKRMQSDLPKVLHKIGQKSMISRTISTLQELSPNQIIVVANPANINLLKSELGQSCQFALQNQPLGTADAVKSALSDIKDIQNIAVLYGDDTAFYKSKTILEVCLKHINTKAKITFVTLIKENPYGLGRIVRKNGKLAQITEEKDATEAQKKIKEINDGLYFFNSDWLELSISKLKPSSVTGELYITDLIELALRENTKVETYKLSDDSQWHGINTKKELEMAQQKITKNIHFMGIAGSGASAVAEIAKANGFDVTGCDLNPKSAYSSSLSIKAEEGHSDSHLKGIDMLVVSPAILRLDPKNIEILNAHELSIPIISWQEFQGKFLQYDKFVIAIAGAYGKSTTTAMVSQILFDQKLDPTCEIGAKVLSWGKNFQIGKSEYYVCEADEYNNNFLNYQPQIAVVLNIAWDHPDFFPTKEILKESYISFINKIKENGYLVTTDDVFDAIKGSIRKDIKVIKIIDFDKIGLSIVGDFRKENADAALTVAKALNLDLHKAKVTISNFTGVGRRLEQKGKRKNTIFFDDYAVQPYTIEKTINALCSKFKNKRVLLILEPHTNTRVQVFFKDFVKSLKNVKVNKIFITEVFTARESADQKSTLSKNLVKAVGQKAQFTGSIKNTAKIVRHRLNNYDVVCSMGAGDSYKLYDLIKIDNG